MKTVVAVVFVISLGGSSLLRAQAAPAQAPPGAPGGRGQGGRGGGAVGRGLNVTFPQQMRKLASPEVIARGKALYGVNCTACHGGDMRGGDQGGPSLLRSLVALSDQHGEAIGPIVRGARQDKGMPAFNLNDADVTALAEYIHSVLAMVGAQARPPGAADPSTLNVLVGNSSAGQAYFKAKCTGCHSVTGDLKGIASKYSDPRTLQNTWVAGAADGGRGGRGGDRGKPSKVVVTMEDGRKLEGTLVRKDDFIVTLILADGTRKSIARNNDMPKVEVHEADEAHKKLVFTLEDKDMHDVTAYLATVK